MDGMNLLITNADGSLEKHIQLIQSAFHRAVDVATNVLKLDKVDIVCLNDKNAVIPEIGIGGYTPSRHLVYLYIDPLFNIEEDEIFYTLCHEFNHARRYDGPGFGKTLFDSMIFEGLATAFEDEISDHKAFLPTFLRNREDTIALLAKSEPSFQSTDFIYHNWFISDPNKVIPRWAGYEMGFYLVNKCIDSNNKKASDLVLEGSDTFLECVRDALRGDSNSS